jgi:GAF domain-containing protein
MDADRNPTVGQPANGPDDRLARPSARRWSAADDDLDDGLIGLARLSMNRLGLEEVLTRVATFAVQAIPGADGAGLTLTEAGRADTVVATAAFVRELDNIQDGMGQGPGITAAAEKQTVMSGSLGDDSRWRKFGGTVARLGVHSVLSLPLKTPDGVVGAMTVYAHDKNAFDVRAAELGEVFAGPAAIAVQNAQVLAQARRLAGRLQTMLQTRRVIDQAVGIIISRTGGTVDEEIAWLQALSQDEHQELVVVSQQIVEEAVRRAEAGHDDD